MNTTQNGNTQLNSERNNLNKRIDNFRLLSKTKKVQWSTKRRWRNV